MWRHQWECCIFSTHRTWINWEVRESHDKATKCYRILQKKQQDIPQHWYLCLNTGACRKAEEWSVKKKGSKEWKQNTRYCLEPRNDIDDIVSSFVFNQTSHSFHCSSNTQFLTVSLLLLVDSRDSFVFWKGKDFGNYCQNASALSVMDWMNEWMDEVAGNKEWKHIFPWGQLLEHLG